MTPDMDRSIPQETHDPLADSALWLPVVGRRNEPRIRLICYPYAGGGVPVFRAWSDLLPPDVELRVAQLPGRGVRLRENRYERMPPLIESLAMAIRPLLDRPLALFGHSLGAIVAFEVARNLCGRGFVPAHLFISGNIAPDLPDPAPPIHELPEDAFLRKLWELNGMPQAVLETKELLELIMPTVRSDFALIETYQYEPGPPLGCPITVFGGLQDPRTTRSGLEGWRSQTTESFELFMSPGDHFFLDTARPLVLRTIAQRFC